MTSRSDQIAQQRLEKLERIRDQGINPYPNRYQPGHTTQQAVALLAQNEAGLNNKDWVQIAGRIMAQRSMGKSAFMDIHDSSGKMQLLFQDINQFDENKLNLFKDLDIGDVIGIEGNLLH